MKKVLATIAMVFGMSSAAQAGMLIEPYLGYEMGDVKYTNVGFTNELKDSLSGTAMGLRLGYKFLLPFVALDYTAGSGKGKNGSPNQDDYDYTRSALGVTAGVDLPLIRGWVGYGFSNNATLKQTSGDVKLKGTYTKAGVGFGFIPFVSLNAEYIMNNFNKIDQGAGEQEMKDVFDPFTNNVIMISISAPFNL